VERKAPLRFASSFGREWLAWGAATPDSKPSAEEPDRVRRDLNAVAGK